MGPTIVANRVDVEAGRIERVTLRATNGRIAEIVVEGPEDPRLPYLLPGFVDAHVHIESSLLPPSEFGRLAVRHGTVAAVSDPHEIANVLGVEGVRWMLDDAGRSPFHVQFGAPSSVPATPFETAGATLGPAEVAALLDEPGIGHLSEVMNVPAALAGDPGLLAKLAAARARGFPIDGHAPGLRGEAVARYAALGIGTDHECETLAEAEEKLAAGMAILIREGSAARNFEALHPLLRSHPGRVMFASDDKHPDDLVRGHIDRLVARAVAKGHDRFDALRAATIVPEDHYRLGLGRLRVGDPLNAALTADLTDFRVLATWLDGALVARDGESLLPRQAVSPANHFVAARLLPAQLRVPSVRGHVRVIGVTDGQLVTADERADLGLEAGGAEPDPAQDVLLLAVANRYGPPPGAEVSAAFVRGFGLRRGALASSVAHDSHDVVGVGASRAELASAMNAVIDRRGGLAVAGPSGVEVLPLPIAGLMSDRDGDAVARDYAALDRAAKALGARLRAPFMALSFLTLLVIPALKLSDRGLFDGRAMRFVSPDASE